MFVKWLNLIPFRAILAIAWPLVGIALVGYGAWLVYPPAGYIAVGALLIVDVFHASVVSIARDLMKERQ